uniref:Uncharacterized protein n=1 Tax=Rousettus aegyptiacus TaxID=9407 RepID=A0A7J8IM11_ROUAE|nr:hypothetical protein HJG63_010825 [Rousettus aegyptiacus]
MLEVLWGFPYVGKNLSTHQEDGASGCVRADAPGPGALPDLALCCLSVPFVMSLHNKLVNDIQLETRRVAWCGEKTPHTWCRMWCDGGSHVTVEETHPGEVTFSCSCLYLERPSLIRCDLIEKNFICKDPTSKEGHILRFQVDMRFGGTRFHPVQTEN